MQSFYLLLLLLSFTTIIVASSSNYYSLNGTGNNLNNLLMGAAHQSLQRLYGFHYAEDGSGKTIYYDNRPQCCNIENMIHTPWDKPNLKQVNLLFVYFG